MGPTYVLINHKNLLHNFNLIRQTVQNTGIMAVVKANAYGHGAVEISRALEQNKADFLGVAFPEEGIQLREAGIKLPILVFGAQLPELLEQHLDYNLDITITSFSQLHFLINLCRKKKTGARIHIKIDTGMNRVGLYRDDFLPLLSETIKYNEITVAGIYTHLSSSDEDEPTYTLQQIDRFREIKNIVTTRYPQKNILFHAANSASIMRYPESYFDIVRPGVMLYGNPPSPFFKTDWKLREVMSFHSRVGLIKKVQSGEPISYNRRFYTKEQTYIGVIPVGYADGYNRKMTNRGDVLVKGRKYPVVGTVCMDQFMVNLGPETDVKEGDDVVLFGKQDNAHITINEIAAKLETIPYEITCWPSQRVPRIHEY